MKIFGFRSSFMAGLTSIGARKRRAARRWGRKAEVFRHLLPHRDQRWLGWGGGQHPTLTPADFFVPVPKISGDGPEPPPQPPHEGHPKNSPLPRGRRWGGLSQGRSTVIYFLMHKARKKRTPLARISGIFFLFFFFFWNLKDFKG